MLKDVNGAIEPDLAIRVGVHDTGLRILHYSRSLADNQIEMLVSYLPLYKARLLSKILLSVIKAVLTMNHDELRARAISILSMRYLLNITCFDDICPNMTVVDRAQSLMFFYRSRVVGTIQEFSHKPNDQIDSSSTYQRRLSLILC